jgi:hypothetical protein
MNVLDMVALYNKHVNKVEPTAKHDAVIESFLGARKKKADVAIVTS